MHRVNPVIADEVEALLPIEGGIAPRHAYTRFGRDRSSSGGFRLVLLHLIRTGRAAREGEGHASVYRRLAQKPLQLEDCR